MAFFLVQRLPPRATTTCLCCVFQIFFVSTVFVSCPRSPVVSVTRNSFCLCGVTLCIIRTPVRYIRMPLAIYLPQTSIIAINFCPLLLDYLYSPPRQQRQPHCVRCRTPTFHLSATCFILKALAVPARTQHIKAAQITLLIIFLLLVFSCIYLSVC